MKIQIDNYQIDVEENQFTLCKQHIVAKIDKNTKKKTGETEETYKPVGHFASLDAALKRLAQHKMASNKERVSLARFLSEYTKEVNRIEQLIKGS